MALKATSRAQASTSEGTLKRRKVVLKRLIVPWSLTEGVWGLKTTCSRLKRMMILRLDRARE